MATYYIDTNDFTTATSIWTNSNLTVKAADGFYQKDGFYRQMSGGELLFSTICPDCAAPCGEPITANGLQGIYYLNINLTNATGAVIIKFNPASIPDGVLALYNSVAYNGLSSPNFGWLQGTAGLPTYIGDSGASCSSTIVTNSPYTLNEFQYNGTIFEDLGTTTNVSIVSGQTQLTSSVPGNSVMVIPKTTASPSVLDLSFIGPCSGTVFNIDVSCPTTLPSFDSSTVNTTSELACAASPTQTYYVAHVNGAAGVLGLYDIVFSDPNGQFKLAAGFYKTNDAGTNEWYQVDANGVVIAFGDCVEPPVESYNCVSGNCVDPGDGTGTYATLGECEAVCSAPSINVQSVGGFMEPCSGGAIDDYMGAIVVLDVPVDVDTQFGVEVFYVETGSTCGGTTFSQSFTVSILAGYDISNFNACTEGASFPTGAVICSACISSCDNPNIIIGSFECPA